MLTHMCNRVGNGNGQRFDLIEINGSVSANIPASGHQPITGKHEDGEAQEFPQTSGNFGKVHNGQWLRFLIQRGINVEVDNAVRIGHGTRHEHVSALKPFDAIGRSVAVSVGVVRVRVADEKFKSVCEAVPIRILWRPED